MDDISSEIALGYDAGMDAGEWVKRVREGAGLTQDEFADRIGIEARPTISRWETGAFAPDFEGVTKIISAFPWAAGILAGEQVVIPPAGLRTMEAREVGFVLDEQPRELRAYVRDMMYRILGERGAKPKAP